MCPQPRTLTSGGTYHLYEALVSCQYATSVCRIQHFLSKSGFNDFHWVPCSVGRLSGVDVCADPVRVLVAAAASAQPSSAPAVPAVQQ